MRNIFITFIILFPLYLLSAYDEILEVVPKESLRFRYSYEQGFDTSCGLATAATVLSMYWGLEVAEEDLVTLISEDSLSEETYTIDFNALLEVFSRYEITARAYRMTLEETEETLSQGYAPLLVHYDYPQEHFACILGKLGDFWITADPARGYEILADSQLEDRFSGAVIATASQDRERNTVLIDQALAEGTERIRLFFPQR